MRNIIWWIMIVFCMTTLGLAFGGWGLVYVVDMVSFLGPLKTRQSAHVSRLRLPSGGRASECILQIASSGPQAHARFTDGYLLTGGNGRGFDALTEFQIANFFHRHNSVTKDDCNNTAANIIKGSVSPTPVQGQASYTVAAELVTRQKSYNS